MNTLEKAAYYSATLKHHFGVGVPESLDLAEVLDELILQAGLSITTEALIKAANSVNASVFVCGTSNWAKAMVAQLSQHPGEQTCWCDEEGVGKPGVSCGDCPKDYAEPVQEPLTDLEIEQCMEKAYATVQGRRLEHAFARAIEAKIKE